jgi:hypothetical protein
MPSGPPTVSIAPARRLCGACGRLNVPVGGFVGCSAAGAPGGAANRIYMWFERLPGRAARRSTAVLPAGASIRRMRRAARAGAPGTPRRRAAGCSATRRAACQGLGGRRQPRAIRTRPRRKCGGGTRFRRVCLLDARSGSGRVAFRLGDSIRGGGRGVGRGMVGRRRSPFAMSCPRRLQEDSLHRSSGASRSGGDASPEVRRRGGSAGGGVEPGLAVNSQARLSAGSGWVPRGGRGLRSVERLEHDQRRSAANGQRLPRQPVSRVAGCWLAAAAAPTDRSARPARRRLLRPCPAEVATEGAQWQASPALSVRAARNTSSLQHRRS